MSKDIDIALKGWDYKPGSVQARLVRARNGREILQMRVDLGLLQMETAGRPDGIRPHNAPTYFDYVRRKARGREDFVLNEEQCEEADREFMQFYHRRLCWLALREFARAVADADHTLAFMDFIRDRVQNEEYVQAHEQYRGFVLFHRTQAAAALALEQDDPEGAIDALRDGLDRLRAFFVEHELEEHLEEDPMVQRLREMVQSLREVHKIEATLQEQLAEAVAREDYEAAARLRDAIRRGSKK